MPSPIALLLTVALTLPPPAFPAPGGPAKRLTSAAAAAGLRPAVLHLAIAAHGRAVSERLTSSQLLTVIDYSLPSRARRLWVLDLRAGRVLAHEYVAHGRNSGDGRAVRFSNSPGSLQSSLGLFLTGRVYQGKHGTSLRLRGLDPELNSEAERRGIVIHGADYVGARTIAALGRLGRSHGCPALAREVASRVIELIRDGTAVFAYHPSAAQGARVTLR